MLASLNGILVRAPEATLPAADRGFLYGDGLFETVRVQSGRLFRWDRHYARLEAGLQRIRLTTAPGKSMLLAAAHDLLRANQFSDGLLRLAISRGVGERGYSPRGADKPTVFIQCFPRAAVPEVLRPMRLVTVATRLWADDPLATIKSSSRLGYVVARAEAEERGADEALLLNHLGEVAEAGSGNLFWLKGGQLFTPALSAGILPGITRAAVLEMVPSFGLACEEVRVGLEGLENVEGMCVTSVGRGVVLVSRIDERTVPLSPILERIARAFEALVESETRSADELPGGARSHPPAVTDGPR